MSGVSARMRQMFKQRGSTARSAGPRNAKPGRRQSNSSEAPLHSIAMARAEETQSDEDRRRLDSMRKIAARMDATRAASEAESANAREVFAKYQQELFNCEAPVEDNIFAACQDSVYIVGAKSTEFG